MSSEFLSSKVVVLEEEPQVLSITALPSTVVLVEGITERGEISTPMLTTSSSEYWKGFGGFTADSQVAIFQHCFFLMGGQFLWVNRTCHFTDVTNKNSFIAVKGAQTLNNAGSTATPGSVTGTNPGPWDMRDYDGVSHNTLDIAIDGGAPVTATWAGTKGYKVDNAVWGAGLALDGLTTLVQVDSGIVQTITFTPKGGVWNVDEAVDIINSQIVGANAAIDVANLRITSDRIGLISTIKHIAGGTADAILTWGASTDGTGNINDLGAVTGLEVDAVVGATAVVTVNSDGTVTLESLIAGAGHSIMIMAWSLADTVIGLDNLQHDGATDAPAPTLTLTGKTPGTYTANLSIVIGAATSLVAAEFNMVVYENGAIRELFPNLTMDATALRYIETIVNHASYGSDLITATDLLLVLTPAQKRPVNGTYAALVGGNDGLVGLTDIDYLGSVTGPTGLYCFDRITSGTVLVIPGATTLALWQGMIQYAEVTREGTLFCVFDPQASRTAQQIVTDTSTILESSEYGAMYWPRVKITNPSKSVFGTGDTITIPPCGPVVGRYAANDRFVGGVYESPAGLGLGGPNGVLGIVVGLEDDPTGDERHQVLDEKWRDYVYPKRINPIVQLEEGPFHIDGGRTLKSTGNWPHVCQRRGMIGIKASTKHALVYFKHRPNNKENRRRVYRSLDKYLEGEMYKGAFETKEKKTAYGIDVSDQLNSAVVRAAGQMKVRIGTKMATPSEFIWETLTADTLAAA
jgi:hypothetical protein